MTDRIALLTGAAGGVGSCAARYLCDKGWHVLASDIDDRAVAALGGLDRITPLRMDVTDQASITATLKEIELLTDGLDGVVNLAGIIALGSVIEMDERTLLRVLNVNALGCYRVNRTFFPLVLKRRGRILNMSSEVGRESGGPFNGAYAMSKHLVEAYSDSLRRELMFLGVRVIKIQPGPLKTDLVSSLGASMDAAIARSTYFARNLTRMKRMVIQEHERAHDPILIARVVHRALTIARPRPCYSVRPGLQRLLLDMLPVTLADALIKIVLSR